MITKIISGDQTGSWRRLCDIFMAHDPAAATPIIATNSSNKFLANIYLLAKQRLLAQNVTAIYGGDYYTYAQEELFFSHWRNHGKTGRMAKGIWLEL